MLEMANRETGTGLKILHVIPSVSPLRGGPSATLRTLVNGLIAQGLSADVATTDDDGPGRLIFHPNEYEDTDRCQYRCFARETRFYTVSRPLRTWLYRNAGEYDAIHIHSLFNWPACVAAAAARRAGVPYIVRPLGTLNHWGLRRRRLLKSLSLRFIESRILRHAAWLHFSTEQERLESETVTAGLPFRVIPNPIADVPATAETDRAADPATILFLSRLDPVKGLDILLPAFAEARRAIPQLKLLLAGSGTPEFTADLRRQAGLLRIRDAVKWTGFLSDEQKERALRRATLFVLPSRSENFGLAAVEAMARGIPILISEGVGIRGEVQAAQAGMVVPCTAEAFAAGMRLLVEDPQLRNRLAANGRRLAESKYSSAVVAGQLAGEYEKLARARVPAAASRQAPACEAAQ
ncbi:MAG: glycosyltransferase [Acidobacteriota bacterium]